MIDSTSNNDKALEWWNSLSLEAQKQIHAESKHSHYTFKMFCMSTHAIRTAWNEQQSKTKGTGV